MAQLQGHLLCKDCLGTYKTTGQIAGQDPKAVTESKQNLGELEGAILEATGTKAGEVGTKPPDD